MQIYSGKTLRERKRFREGRHCEPVRNIKDVISLVLSIVVPFY